MAEFKVCGPFSISIEERQNGREVLKDNFWGSKEGAPEELKRKRGVYVFAIKTSGTTRYIPCYVGQAKKTFAEGFTNDKLLKYNRALMDYIKGVPKIFFLVHQGKKTNKKHINAIEDYLIMMGFAVNPEIQNDKGTKLPTWSISGVIRSTTKKPSKAAKFVTQMFEIKGRKGI